MKFTEHLGAHLTPEWRSQYIRYEQLKDVLYGGLEKLPPKDENPDSVIQGHFSSFEEQWFRYCDEELEKINTFFAEKIAEAGRKYTTLKNELHMAGSLKVGPSLSTLATSKKVTLAPEPSKKVKVKTNKKVNHLKFAFGEFYLSLVLLQNYQQLNFTGFRKILKKHDKLFETTNGADYRKEKVEVADFFVNKHVDELILNTEELYISELEDGNRSKAMKRLRVPPLAEELRHGDWVSCRVGFLAGLFLMLSSVATITAFFTDHSGEFDIAIRIYRGVFLFVLVTFLLAVNTWGWRQAGVNHVLIFELDPRDHLSYQQLLEVALLLGVLWAISLVVFMFNHVLGIESYSPNLVLVSFLFLFTINPFKICYYKARFWLLKVLFRIFTAPFQHVGFADFWLADQLNSLAVALLDFQFIICFYAHDWHVTNPKDMICDGTLYGIRPLVACLPAWFRFAQCLRRYRDTKHAFPHLVNAGKYSTAFFVVAFSTLAKSESVRNDHFFMLWIVAAFISTCYTLTWDIKMDWGLLDKKSGENKFLREETVYRSKAFYYFAMVEDLIFRLLWTLTVSVGELEIFHSELLKLILSVCEVFRRFIWNFFRLENEHLNNCGQFRAVRDISVVPMETNDQAFLEQMMDDMDGLVLNKRTGQRRRRSVMTKSMKKISSKTDGVVIKRETEVIIENETLTSL
ncbi:xenotropic and polytropic retrovirus receptor 1-like [Stylophora pistillata]|uniref:Xenotropic and polytropic retrovirus receptor 1 n=1 Tax=Stylophora pistillata TaxID=50429 RepID=A0A2B4SY38_STYPI|nr:xenotropic and polytropic retrovirus receptor 1-like [Stylophora pistillata]PFX33295.1 Xenotropic and polytropic retrovirus receptor 1 [Stylophora pistillata]